MIVELIATVGVFALGAVGAYALTHGVAWLFCTVIAIAVIGAEMLYDSEES